MDTFFMQDGSPLDLDKVYTVATTQFLTLGKDGFDAFLDPAVEDATGQLDEAITVQELIKQFLRNFRRTPARVDDLKPLKYYPIFLERLQMMGTSVDNRDEENGFMIIAPKVDGRIINIQPPIEHND